MGFADQSLRLKALLSKADSLEMLNPETYKLTLLQALNGYEVLASKKRTEAQRLRDQITFCEAQAATCEIMVQILGDIVESLIHKEEQGREEKKRIEEERASRMEGPSGPPAAESSSTPLPEPGPPKKRRGRPPKNRAT